MMPRKDPPSIPLKPMEQVSPSLSPGAAAQTRFTPMLQGTATNTLAKTSVHRTPPQIDEVTGLATITDGAFTLFISGYDSLAGGLRVSVQKLLDIFTMALTQQSDYRGKQAPQTLVSVALDDYMDAMGIPHTKASKDKARRRVKEDLDTLFNCSMEWSEPVKGQQQDFAKTRLCSAVGIQRGRAFIEFTPAYLQYLTHSYLMQYPRAILQLSEKFTNSYHLGRKLLQHRSMYSNQRKGTADILSVKVLLDHAPELPTFEQVRATDRAYARRIIEPFERDLNALADTLRWNYCNAGGAPLTEEQLAHFTYDVFAACYVHFEVFDFPARESGQSSPK